MRQVVYLVFIAIVLLVTPVPYWRETTTCVGEEDCVTSSDFGWGDSLLQMARTRLQPQK